MALSFLASSSASNGSRVCGIWGGDDVHTELPFCHCGVTSRLQTSMMEGNSGRCFYGCVHFGRALVNSFEKFPPISYSEFRTNLGSKIGSYSIFSEKDRKPIEEMLVMMLTFRLLMERFIK